MTVDKETLDLLLTVLRRFVNERLIPAERKVEELNDIPEDILA